MKKFFIGFLSLFFLLPTLADIPKPKLILQITIDQFSGNHLMRYKKHIKKGGFRYLLDNGIWFDNAHQEHATTETAVGHTTLATGAPPAIHGIIANYWFDTTSQQTIYALDDAKHGVSPKNITATSFADSLAIGSLGQAKRFAVSAKDRGAIPLAGKSGKAFWFDTKTGNYRSSSYYYKKLPFWVKRFNLKQRLKIKLGKTWRLMKECKFYLFCQDNKQHLPLSKSQSERIFSHPYGDIYGAKFFDAIYDSPESDSLTLAFAKALVKAEKIGRGKQTDYLAISLSATDAIGHTYGPYSLESEDNFIHLNQSLNDFLKFIDKKVGLKNTLIVLSSDHGAGPTPTYLSNFNFHAIEINDNDIRRQKEVRQLLKAHHLQWHKLVNAEYPNLYLNHQYLEAKKIQPHEFSFKLANAISHTPGIHIAISQYHLNNNDYQLPYLKKLLVNQINPKRSGDLYLVTTPHSYFGNKSYNKAHHGTPWQYDTHVPIIFSHPSFKEKRIHQYVTTRDIAPTLAYILNIEPPAQATGKILSAIVDTR